uniref:Transcriptional regulator n=1 Tax=Macrostomum lignano TaxID=282301 RepID=A0A1I8FRR3_9PLAT
MGLWLWKCRFSIFKRSCMAMYLTMPEDSGSPVLTIEELLISGPHSDSGAAESGERVWGAAYRLAEDEVARVRSHLDEREKAGYGMLPIQFYLLTGPASR